MWKKTLKIFKNLIKGIKIIKNSKVSDFIYVTKVSRKTIYELIVDFYKNMNYLGPEFCG
jgi:hypothetical protein